MAFLKQRKKTEYDIQAEKFMAECQVEIDRTRIVGVCPQWCDGEKHTHGQAYYVCLYRIGRGYCEPVSFQFFNSISDTKNVFGLSNYSILACLSSDVNCPDTFDDFCAEYGYDNDSMKAHGTFILCKELSDKLKAFFTKEEIEKLQEIK
jgi:hypothetical protein